MAGSGGFDMSKMSSASKILAGGALLLLLDSFILSWQKVCFDYGVGIPGGACAKFSAWAGDAGFAGVIMGLGALALLAWEGMQLAGQSPDVGMPASKVSAYLGFGVLGFGALKFVLIISNYASLGAYVGVVLLLAIGYGAYMRLQEPAASGSGSMPAGGGGDAPPAPPAAPGGDSPSGF